MFTVVYTMDDDTDAIDHSLTVVGTLVNGEVVPFTFDDAFAYAEATDGAVWID